MACAPFSPLSLTFDAADDGGLVNAAIAFQYRRTQVANQSPSGWQNVNIAGQGCLLNAVNKVVFSLLQRAFGRKIFLILCGATQQRNSFPQVEVHDASGSLLPD